MYISNNNVGLYVVDIGVEVLGSAVEMVPGIGVGDLGLLVYVLVNGFCLDL